MAGVRPSRPNIIALQHLFSQGCAVVLSSAVRDEIAVETCENGSHEKGQREVALEERGQHRESARCCDFAADPVPLSLLLLFALLFFFIFILSLFFKILNCYLFGRDSDVILGYVVKCIYFVSFFKENDINRVVSFKLPKLVVRIYQLFIRFRPFHKQPQAA